MTWMVTLVMCMTLWFLKCLDDETFPPVKTKHLICKRHKLEYSEHVVNLPFKLDIVLYITMGNNSMMLVFLTL